MATEDKQRILDWCGADSDVRYLRDGVDPGADFSLVLESAGSELTATLASGSDRIVLRSVVDLAQAAQPAGSGDLAADLSDLEERRPGPVTVVLEPAGEAVAVSTWIVSDGLTKHTFLTAVSDVTRTRGAVLRLAGLPVHLPATEAAETEAAPEEREAPEVSLSGASTEAVPEMSAVSEQTATSEPSPWSWTPPTPTPVYSTAEDAAAVAAAEGAEGEPVSESEPATETPVEEPAAETPSAEEPVSAFSAWGAATSAAAEPEPEPSATTEPAAEQTSPFGGWGSPQVTPAEEPVAETPAAAVEEPASPFSVWGSPQGAPAVEEPAAETPVAGAEEQVPAYSPWGSPALTPEQPTQAELVAGTPATGGEEQEPATASPWATSEATWATPEATTEEAAPAATPVPTEEQPAEVSPWGSPAATSFETVTSPSQGYQPEAAPAGFEATPGPVGPLGGYSAGSGQGYQQPYTSEAAATPAPAPAPVQPAWTPSHRVPPQGMQAWAAPDPAGAVIATLGGHLPVQVTEVRGAWAHVLCSNGWTGWVDDRLLIVGA